MRPPATGWKCAAAICYLAGGFLRDASAERWNLSMALCAFAVEPSSAPRRRDLRRIIR
jgi:hypothetical protein